MVFMELVNLPPVFADEFRSEFGHICQGIQWVRLSQSAAVVVDLARRRHLVFGTLKF